MKPDKFLFVVIFVFFIFTSNISPNKIREKTPDVNSFCISPHVSSNAGIKTLYCFNLEFLDDKFYLKGYIEPKNNWNENSTISFQFEVDTEMIRRMVEPIPEGFPSEFLKMDLEKSFLSTEFSDNDWKNKTYVSNFDCREDQNRNYQIHLYSNENFKKTLKEHTKKSLYFEICFLTENYDKKGHKLDMKGKKEIYLLIDPMYFAVGSKDRKPESLFFAMHFEGKEIEDYYPKDAIIKRSSIKYYLGEWILRDAYIKDNTIYRENVEYHILRKNYEMWFIIHLTLKDPPRFLERYAPEISFSSLVIGVLFGALSILGVQSLWGKIKKRR